MFLPRPVSPVSIYQQRVCPVPAAVSPSVVSPCGLPPSPCSAPCQTCTKVNTVGQYVKWTDSQCTGSVALANSVFVTITQYNSQDSKK